MWVRIDFVRDLVPTKGVAEASATGATDSTIVTYRTKNDNTAHRVVI